MCSRQFNKGRGSGETEHYIVLPSNACATTHPNNTASNYIVSWETPIELDDPSLWKVALTEITFNHTISTINPNYGLRYGLYEYDTLDFYIDLKKNSYVYEREKTFSNEARYPRQSNGSVWPPFHIDYMEDSGKLRFSSVSPFEVTELSTKTKEALGIKNNIIVTYEMLEDGLESRWCFFSDDPVELTDDGNLKVDRLFNLDIYITYRSKQQYLRERQIFFRETQYFSTVDELIYYIMDGSNMYHIFETLNYTPINHRCNLKLRPRIEYIRFLNGFNFVLGFANTKFVKNTDYKASYPPLLTLALRCMYVYASICNPIQVGDVRVPLLRSIWPNDRRSGGSSFSLFETHNIIIKNPMYVGVSSAIINSIEINIRSDSGEFVSFPPNSITSITIHLKKDVR